MSRVRQFSKAALVLLGLLSVGERACAEVSVRLGPNFSLLEGATGVDGCLPRDLAKEVLRDRILDANERAGVDPQIAVVFSLEVPPCADLFYAAVENDVRGIGYQHFYPQELFDDSPDAALEGVAFLNDVPYWEIYPEELRRAFLHEVGHRWGVRVHVAGDDPTALLGRDREHFSYFLDTSSARGVSPLEGNIWRETGTHFVTETDGASSGYSDLDLYLMGVLAPEEVAPFRLVVPEDERDLIDCSGARLDETSPPQRCAPLELRATEREFSIFDVLEVEGVRDPPASAGPVVVEIGFYFFTSEGAWTVEGCEHWEREVRDLDALFERATDGRMSLSNVMSEGPSCDQLVASLNRDPRAGTAPWASSSPSCALGQGRRPYGFPLLVFVTGLFWLRRWPKKVPG